MIPPVPPSSKSRMRLVRRLAILCAVLMIALGTSIAVGIANHSNTTANRAAKEAKSTVDCVNRVLAQRNKPTLDETNAQVMYARANATYAKDNAQFVTALVDVLIAPKAQQAKEYAVFLAVVKRYEATAVADANAAAAYIAALVKVEKERNAHPLGRCT